MVDLALGALLAGLAIRGWSRGLVRQALDVATLIVGAVVALRFSTVTGSVVSGVTGLSDATGRIVGGAALFLAVSVGAALASKAIHGAIRRLPALTTLNRLAGAALGALYALVLAVLALTLLTVFPAPDGVTEAFDDSTIAAALTDPDGPVQQAVSRLSGDRVRLEALIPTPRA